MLYLVVIALAGAVAGAINAVAGGGSLISFPALTGFDLPLKIANATNSVGIWPGALGSAFGFQNVFEATKRYFLPLLPSTIVGSLLGAWLLTVTRNDTFKIIVPILILIATLLLAFQPQIRRYTQRSHRKTTIVAGMVIQLLVAIYGGYFGACMGIMMLASFSLYMDGNIHELNAVKAWLGLAINLVASLLFIFEGMILLKEGLALSIGAVVGGFVAAKYSQRLDSEKLRKAIVVLGFGMVAWFTYKTVA
jgi:uncharacterized membrane protein YfcA